MTCRHLEVLAASEATNNWRLMRKYARETFLADILFVLVITTTFVRGYDFLCYLLIATSLPFTTKSSRPLEKWQQDIKVPRCADLSQILMISDRAKEPNRRNNLHVSARTNGNVGSGRENTSKNLRDRSATSRDRSTAAHRVRLWVSTCLRVGSMRRRRRTELFESC